MNRREFGGWMAGVLAVGKAAEAANWPQFRGATGLGVATEAGLPLEWSDTRNLKWKAALPGPGSSSPIVWGDRVFVTCYTGYGGAGGDDPKALQRVLVCVDRAAGKLLWQRSVAAVQPEDPYRGYLTEHGYASSSPATDGERVYVFFGKSGVLAYDFAGNKLWQTSVGTGSDGRGWGSAASLVLHKELVIVNASSESRTVQALDRKTGRMVWKLVDEQRLDLAYNTPVLTKLPTGRVELVLSVPNVVWGLDPDTGKGLWWARTATGGNICPTVVADGDRVYAMGGFPNTGTVAVRAGGQGDVTNTHTLWSSRYTSYVPSCVVAGGKLFWLNDKGMAYGLDGANGNLLFEQRMNLAATGGGSLVYASALLAGDRVYAVTRKEGTVVMSAGQRFKLLAQNRFASDSSQFNGSPAAADGQLFLRSDRFLYCVSGT